MTRFLTICLVVLALFSAWQYHVIKSKAGEFAAQASIARAITDSVHYYHDRLGREVASKAGIQATLSQVEDNYKLLTHNQQLLVTDLQNMPRVEQKKMVAGTSVQQEVKFHLVDTVVVRGQYQRSWRRVSDTLNYSIHVQADSLSIDTLSLPNRIFLAHYFDKEKQLHVSVTNSNHMFKTQDVDTIIPPMKKKGFWGRVLAVFTGN